MSGANYPMDSESVGSVREKMIRLMVDSLDSMGFKDVAALLREEAHLPPDPPQVREFRDHLRACNWMGVINSLEQLDIAKETAKKIESVARTQLYLEFIQKKDILQAVKSLQSLAPLLLDSSALHRLSILLMSRNDFDTSSMLRGETLPSRELAQSCIQDLIPSSIMFPSNSLERIIQCALPLQHTLPASSSVLKLWKPTAVSSHSSPVLCCNFSPDGRLCATGEQNGIISILGNKPSWKRQASISLQSPITQLCWSPNSEKVVAASGNMTKVFKISPLELLFEINQSHFITDLSASSEVIVTTSIDGTTCVYDWSGKRQSIFRLGISNCVSLVSNYVAVGCQGKQIYIIDLAASRVTSCTKTEAEPVSLRFSPAGEALSCYFASEVTPKVGFTACADLIIFSHKDGTIEKETTLSGLKQCKFVSHPCWGPANTIFCGSEDSSVVCWTVLGVFISRLTHHSGPVNQVDYNSVDESLVSASDDRTVCFWQTAKHN